MRDELVIRGDSPRRRWQRASTIVAIVVVVALGAWLVHREQTAPSPALSPTRYVVFPFEVRAGPELQYLREAVMDLLSPAVDGAGDLRRVHPNTVMRRLEGRHSSRVDPALGATLATELGAGRFLLGAVSGVSGQLRISASMYDAAASSDPIATSSVEGDETTLTAMVEAVARELLSTQTLGAGARLHDIRSVRAANFGALRDCLQAEAFLRRGWFDSAGPKLASAVRVDSTFALAWYRLAYAQRWGAAGLPRESFAHAMRYRDFLSPRDRLLVEGRTAYNRGNAASAESIATPSRADILTMRRVGTC